jgi:hypothetical protein
MAARSEALGAAGVWGKEPHGGEEDVVVEKARDHHTVGGEDAMEAARLEERHMWRKGWLDPWRGGGRTMFWWERLATAIQ